MRHVRSIVRSALALLMACLMTEFSAGQTASVAANQRRAKFMQNSVASNPNAKNSSNWGGAISASIGGAVDRRVNADTQSVLVDPNLLPLPIIAPNVNGEDEASTQTQLETLTPLRRARAKYTGFTSAALSSSNPRRVQTTPVLKGPPVDSPTEHRPSIHRSHSTGTTDITSPARTRILAAEKDLRRGRVHRSRSAGLSKARHQQQIYLRDCSKLFLPELECGGKPGQQGSQVDTTRLSPAKVP